MIALMTRRIISALSVRRRMKRYMAIGFPGGTPGTGPWWVGPVPGWSGVRGSGGLTPPDGILCYFAYSL
ncbi:hypothetical protein GCM10009540_75440 [Streptomyces turgidiscabies]